jgi:hypothetical protein
LDAFAALPDGRIATLERGARRLQFLDSLGNAVHIATLAESIEINTPGAFLSDGRYVGFRYAWPEPEPSVAATIVREVVPLLLFDSTGAVSQRLAHVPGHPWWITGTGRRGAPLAPRASVAAGAEFVVYSDGISYHITLIDLTSGSERSMALAEPPELVSADMPDAWLAEQNTFLASRGIPPRRLPEGWKSLVPDRIPGYWRLTVSEGGCVWALRYRTPGVPTQRWDVIDPWKAELVATAAFDAGFDVSQIAREHVVGLRSDTLGVQRIAAYSVSEPSAMPRCERTSTQLNPT